MPTTPQYAAGSLVDPPVSVAKALFLQNTTMRTLMTSRKRGLTRDTCLLLQLQRCHLNFRLLSGARSP